MNEIDERLVYVGKIIELLPISNADFILSATVICGKGGKWKGVVRKSDFELYDLCVVYLPDAVVRPCEEMQFLESSGWRVKMRRFKGVPSEVVIMPMGMIVGVEVGYDLTPITGVKRYFKPVPANLACLAKGVFPSFIPKTDELNYQRVPELVEALHGKPYYVTEKADGSSTTAYKYLGEFGICSRNLDLQRDENNGYWQVAIKYKLEENLPDGFALQWETCGPKIQDNPMGLNKIDGFAFSAYDIENRKYLEMYDLITLCKKLNFPMVEIVILDQAFDKSRVDKLGEGKYENGHEREGVVVRSAYNLDGGKPISFKVINLNYER